MSVMFCVMIVLVSVFMVGAFVVNFFHPQKQRTAQEHTLDLAVTRDHSITPHISQLYNASAKLETTWSNGEAEYEMTLMEVKPALAKYVGSKPDYHFVVTWYEGSAPSACIIIPFKKFEVAESVTGEPLLKAKGTVRMTQEQYEHVYDGRSWDLNWGPLRKTAHNSTLKINPPS